MQIFHHLSDLTVFTTSYMLYLTVLPTGFPFSPLNIPALCVFRNSYEGKYYIGN